MWWHKFPSGIWMSSYGLLTMKSLSINVEYAFCLWLNSSFRSKCPHPEFEASDNAPNCLRLKDWQPDLFMILKNVFLNVAEFMFLSYKFLFTSKNLSQRNKPTKDCISCQYFTDRWRSFVYFRQKWLSPKAFFVFLFVDLFHQKII